MQVIRSGQIPRGFTHPRWFDSSSTIRHKKTSLLKYEGGPERSPSSAHAICAAGISTVARKFRSVAAASQGQIPPPLWIKCPNDSSDVMVLAQAKKVKLHTQTAQINPVFSARPSNGFAKTASGSTTDRQYLLWVPNGVPRAAKASPNANQA